MNNKINLFEKYTYELSFVKNINNPEFHNTTLVHDWRNYIPYDWQENWNEFTDREKQIMVVMAQMQADKENWD